MGIREKRVVLFGPWPPPYGGVATHVKNLVQNLEERAIAVRTLGYGEFVESPTVKRISPYRKGWMQTLRRLCFALRPRAILHDHSSLLPYPDERLLRSLHWVVKLRRARWILSLHDQTLLDRFHTWPETMRDLFPQFLQWPEHIICDGDHIRDFLARLGVSRHRLTNIPPLLPLRAGSTACLPAHIEKFVVTHTPILTAIGVFHPYYDFLTIANAFTDILLEHPAAGLILIDAGFAVDESYRGSVLRTLQENPGAAYMVLSHLSDDELLQVLRQSAVLIRGFRHESFGLSRAEAILMGTPVIATNAGETRHMTVYEYGDPDDLRRKVRGVLAQPPDLSEAQAYFQRMSETTLDQILNVYSATC